MDINFFLSPSSSHSVVQNEQNFTISQKSDSKTDRYNFQAIAKKAMAYSGSDYEILPHKNADYGVNEFDSITFIKT